MIRNIIYIIAITIIFAGCSPENNRTSDINDSFFVNINSSKIVSDGKDVSVDNLNFRQKGDTLIIDIYSEKNKTDLIITNQASDSIVYSSYQNLPGLISKVIWVGDWTSGNSSDEIIQIEITDNLHTISYYFPLKK